MSKKKAMLKAVFENISQGNVTLSNAHHIYQKNSAMYKMALWALKKGINPYRMVEGKPVNSISY